MGKYIGTPGHSHHIGLFGFPMKKPKGRKEGPATANPYYGSMMYDCGSAVEALPKSTADMKPMKQQSVAPQGRVLAVPRSAVIDTGRAKVVYVESSPGGYVMRALKSGPLANAPA